MNGVIYYSNTGRSRAVAEYFARETGWAAYDLNDSKQAQAAADTAFERAVLVFPVYCQSIPDAVKALLDKLRARYLTAVATYGKMCYGRVLFELQRSYTAGKRVGAAYFPMSHSYLKKEEEVPFISLYPLILKMREQNPKPAVINRTYKNPFVGVGKDARSRMLVKMVRDGSKCVGCGKCERDCLFGGIKNGRFNRRCKRCLKCVMECPTGALSFICRLPLRLYLKKKPIERFIIYV